jgi:cytidyltransferase-like protein
MPSGSETGTRDILLETNQRLPYSERMAPDSENPPVILSGPFDNPRPRELRLLQEAARLGPLRVRLWTDETIEARTGAPPLFPFDERRYLLESIRWVTAVEPGDNTTDRQPVFTESRLSERPDPTEGAAPSGRPGVLVTGCYDWVHSGHVRFFEECAGYGELTVVVGNDINVRALKGEGHPLFPQEDRRYWVGAIRHVHRVLISTGMGWLDAEEQIRQVKPAIYAVTEDGDRPEKRRYCEEHGLRYLVLKRLPKPGLPIRHSTNLRGF